MLRYIVGISIISVVLMLIRYLSNGKILKKHQYAMWLIIPVCMVLLPFIRIGVPIPEELSPYIPISEETVTADKSSDYVVYEITEVSNGEISSYEQRASGNELTESNINTEELILSEHDIWNVRGAEQGTVNVWKILNDISVTVSVILIALLTVYNVIFVLYCMRNSKFIGRDPISGLGIYGISHKGTPFLLFNRIYVDKDFNKVGKYTADNEVYVDNISGRLSSYIICHEACHYRHGDYIWVIVRYLVLAVNWYNPFIWAAFILSGRDCELACDEEVVRCSEDNSSVGYATSLLEMMRQRSKMSFEFTVSTGMRGGFEIMKKRIVSIINPSKKSYKTLVVGMAALIVVSSVFVLEPRAAERMPEEEAVAIEDIDGVLFDEDEGISSVKAATKKGQDIFFYRDSIAVKGKLFLPKGEGPFKTVIMCGAYSSAFYEGAARRFTDYGYAAVVFEFSNNDIMDTTTKPDGKMAHEMLLDFNAVLDGLRYLPDVDRSNIYLWGHSVGGFITAYEGMKKGSEIKGMIMVEPYLTETQELTHDNDGLSNSYINLYYMFSYSSKPSMLIARSGYQGLDEMNKAANYMTDGKLVVIDSEDSLFEDVYPMVAKSVEAFISWDK